MDLIGSTGSKGNGIEGSSNSGNYFDLSDTDLVPNPGSKVQSFKFDKLIDIQLDYIQFQFRCVTGFVPIEPVGLLKNISKQYLVKPYVRPDSPAYKLIQDVSKNTKSLKRRYGKNTRGVEKNLQFLFTEIELSNPFWKSSQGKKTILILEKELQAVSELSNDGVDRVFAFNIEKLEFTSNGDVSLNSSAARKLSKKLTKDKEKSCLWKNICIRKVLYIDALVWIPFKCANQKVSIQQK
ncbi:unnamed protein product [Ambrosiozyma monospora]|uniref:Unnamed protein product n=1 Tax=Ambrosiozyma monospora TaxID=43982 RepID=A0ACB5U7N7_AMBMO|nr:unnamed protein product [Ambrosiozyma monospora]